MKKLIGYWNLYERIWLVAFSAVAILITVWSGDNLFGFAVFLSGVLCVVLVAKGNILNYPAGMFNTVGYAWLAAQNGLYGEVGLNLLFYLPMNFIGFFMWRRHMDAGDGMVIMKRMGGKALSATAAACLACILALGALLDFIPSQNTAYVDAATNVLSVAATILMVRRYREQWMAYITLNVLSVIMWSVRALAGSPDGPLMVVMWSAYLVNSVYGLYNWTKGAKAIGKERAGA